MFLIGGLILAVSIGGFTTYASPIDAASKYHIEKRVDDLIPIVNQYIHRKGLDSIQIPDFGYPAAPVFIEVKLRNMSTIYRKGDALMWEKSSNSLTVQVMAGLKDMEFDVLLCTFMHGPVTGKIGEATINVTFSWNDQGKEKPCVTVWESFIIEEMKDVVFFTENQDWNGKPPPDYILKDIIDNYNKWNNIDEVREKAGEYLDLCEPLYYNNKDSYPKLL